MMSSASIIMQYACLCVLLLHCNEAVATSSKGSNNPSKRSPKGSNKSPKGARSKGSKGCSDNALNMSGRNKPSMSDSIAIVGGGVHGLFAARALKRGGYSNIMVFEKEENLAAIAESFSEDGHTFDYSTKFIPADSVTGPGINAELQEMISQYGLSARWYTAPTLSYDFEQQSVGALPRVLIPYLATPALLVQNMIEGFELLREAAAAGRNPLALIEAGIVLKSETWAQYAQRINLPAFTDLCEFLHDSFLGGPAAEQPAAVVLNVRAIFQPPYIKGVLLASGIDKDTPLPISSELRAVLGNPFPGSSYVINEGYQTFFDNLAEYEGINICLGCEVTKITPSSKTGGGVAVWAQNQKQKFDHVIISSRPHDSLELLENCSPLKSLVSAASDFDPVTVFAFRAGTTPAGLPSTFAALIYPPSSSFFPADGTVTALAKDFADSNVCVAIAYADPEATDNEAVEKASMNLDSYGFSPISKLIGYRKYAYVSSVPADEVENDWFVKMEDLQGAGNVYVIGEALSGFGVPVALNFVNDFYDRYFADEE